MWWMICSFHQILVLLRGWSHLLNWYGMTLSSNESFAWNYTVTLVSVVCSVICRLHGECSDHRQRWGITSLCSANAVSAPWQHCRVRCFNVPEMFVAGAATQDGEFHWTSLKGVYQMTSTELVWANQWHSVNSVD